MKAKKFKVVKVSLKEYLLATTMPIILVLFAVMLGAFYINITLELKTREIQKYLEEYELLKQEINMLTEIKDNYEIIIEDNKQLQSKKDKLENKISELSYKISLIDNKIDKFNN